jgi:hypothetical protein
VFLGTQRAQQLQFGEAEGYTKQHNKEINFAVNPCAPGVLLIGSVYEHIDDPRYMQAIEDGFLGTYTDTGEDFVDEWWKLVNHEVLHDVLNQTGCLSASRAIDSKLGRYTRFGLASGWLNSIDLVLYRERFDV